MYILKIKPNKRWIYVQKMLKDRLYYGSQTVSVPYYYVKKHLSCLTYGRAPAKGSNSALTRNRRIDIKLHQREWMHKIEIQGVKRERKF